MEDSKFKPFVADDQKIPELSVLPIFMGCILGVIFGASSLYLALKVGMTVSASIPVAVLSITLFRAFSKAFGIRKTTILENNIVQTTGSAGESIAFGVAVTMPALFILGYDMTISRTMLVSILGGLLGVLMMIPLRWALIVRGHKELRYPEGTACADVLMVGEKGGTSAVTVFTGFFFGLIYKFLNVGIHLWNDVPENLIRWYKGAAFSTEVSPELLGVGYIIGPRVALITVAGGLLSSFVLTPAIILFGSGLKEPLFPATQLISQMSVHDVWRSYVLYIGAGTVAAGGIISLFQSLPVIGRSFVAGFKSFQESRANGANKKIIEVPRTERDIPSPVVLLGSLGLILAIWLSPSLNMNLAGSVLIVLFGFLFVTVSSRITGEIGSSSNPISGMTVATLLFTCLIFVMVGWVGPGYRVTALSIAAIVCIAASNGGTISQDLKTGYLVGATPRSQQIAILIGALTSAVVIGYTLQLLNDASTIYAKRVYPQAQFNLSQFPDTEKIFGPERHHDDRTFHVMRLTEPAQGVPEGRYLLDDSGHVAYLVDPGINGSLQKRDDGTEVQKYEAPKARLMSMIIDGILTQKLPWSLVLLGIFIAIVLECCGVSSLPFAVGVYLPLSSTTPIAVGGILRWLVEKWDKKKEDDSNDEFSPGVLLSSGLIAGGSIAGIGIALASMKESWARALDFSGRFPVFSQSNTASYCMFGIMVIFTFIVAKGIFARRPST